MRYLCFTPPPTHTHTHRTVRTMPLFRSSPKSPQELVKSLSEAIKVLDAAEPGSKKGDKVCSYDIVYVLMSPPSSLRPLMRVPN